MPIAQEMKNLTEDIAVSYGERMSWLEDAMKDTHQMMTRFGREHKAMAEKLGTFLGDSESTRISNFKEMLSQIQSRQREREEEVAGVLSESREAMKDTAAHLKEMAAQLRKFLSHSEETRREEFKGMLSAIKSRERAREEEVATLLGECQEDMKEARAHWRNLAKILASKRGGKKVPITEVPKEAKVPKRVEEAAEKAFEEGELKAKALDLIEESPQGISLSQLGKKLGVAYVRLAKPIKELLDEGKVVKRDSLYFPA